MRNVIIQQQEHTVRISVIIPCHNASPWIIQALHSVTMQTYPTHEVIVIDDNSTDDTVLQIKNAGVSVRLLHSNACNAAATRNIGIETATGEWVALLDADDIWYPNHLSRAVNLLNGGKDVAFMSNHDWINLDGKPIPMPKEYKCKLPEPTIGLSLEDFFDILRSGFHFGHSTVLYRRDRLMEVGMFDITLKRRHDIDLWLRVIAGQEWVYDTEKSAGYREETPESISKNHKECDYYYLLALSKNIIRTDFPSARHYLARQARRAMGIAFVDGPQEHYRRILEVAWPYLPSLYKFIYSCGSFAPDFLRNIITIKRYLLKSSMNTSRSAGSNDL